MKIVIIRGHLKDAVYGVIGATTENQNLPILKNILLEAAEGKITVRATNLELAISYSVPGKVMEPGKVTVPASAFLQIVTNLSSERINLEEKNGILQIKTDNYEATLQGISAEEFPTIPTIQKESGKLAIKGVLLKEGLSQVVPCAQVSELRPELGSVLFSFSIDALKLVATDSFRLAEKTFTKNQFQSSHKEAFQILVPIKTAHEILKITQDDDEVTIKEDGSQVVFETESYSVLSRLVNGRFPDYQAIIPKEFGTKFVVDAEEFMGAVKLCAVFGSRANETKVAVEENKKSVTISSGEQGLGENTSAIAARVEGDPKQVIFNWRYLLDGVRAVRGSELLVAVNDDAKPALLKAPNEASYFYIVMPVLRA